MYPMLEDGVTLRISRHEPVIRYYAEKDGKQVELSCSVFKALQNADGKTPLDLPEDVSTALIRGHLIRSSRFVPLRDDADCGRLIFFVIGRYSRQTQKICRAINGMLPRASLLLFLTGLFIRILCPLPPVLDFHAAVYILAYISLIMIHETGHIIAAVAYGYEVTDAGLLMVWRFPLGAYTHIKNREDVLAKWQIQLSLAGIEAELLFNGLYMLLSTVSGVLSGTLYIVSVIDILTVLLNLMPAAKGDGYDALNQLVGVDDIFALSKRIKNKRYCRRLSRSLYLALLFTYYSRYSSIILHLAGFGFSIFITMHW